MRCTNTQAEGYRSKRKRGMTNGRVRCYCLCTRTYCKSQIRVYQVVSCMYQSTPRLTPMWSSLRDPFFSWGRFEKNNPPSGALSLRRHISPSKMSWYSPCLRGLVCHSSNIASTPGTLKIDLSWSDNDKYGYLIKGVLLARRLPHLVWSDEKMGTLQVVHTSCTSEKKNLSYSHLFLLISYLSPE